MVCQLVYLRHVPPIILFYTKENLSPMVSPLLKDIFQISKNFQKHTFNLVSKTNKYGKIKYPQNIKVLKTVSAIAVEKGTLIMRNRGEHSFGGKGMKDQKTSFLWEESRPGENSQQSALPKDSTSSSPGGCPGTSSTGSFLQMGRFQSTHFSFYLEQ